MKRKHYKNRRGDGEKRARDLESNKLEKDLRRQGAELQKRGEPEMRGIDVDT